MLSRRQCIATPVHEIAPWGHVAGFDEHISGTKLALQPTRKSMHLNFSFVELGGIMCEILLWPPETRGTTVYVL